MIALARVLIVVLLVALTGVRAPAAPPYAFLPQRSGEAQSYRYIADTNGPDGTASVRGTVTISRVAIDRMAVSLKSDSGEGHDFYASDLRDGEIRFEPSVETSPTPKPVRAKNAVPLATLSLPGDITVLAAMLAGMKQYGGMTRATWTFAADAAPPIVQLNPTPAHAPVAPAATVPMTVRLASAGGPETRVVADGGQNMDLSESPAGAQSKKRPKSTNDLVAVTLHVEALFRNGVLVSAQGTRKAVTTVHWVGSVDYVTTTTTWNLIAQ